MAPHITPLLRMTKKPRRWVSMQTRFNSGNRSPVKCSLIVRPQKGIWYMKRSCITIWVPTSPNTPCRPLPAPGSTLKASWWSCSAGAYRWPHSSHRPSQWERWSPGHQRSGPRRPGPCSLPGRWQRESTIILGAMTEEKVTSKRDKEVRKTYIGGLGLWLLTMVITMRRFPKMVNTYMIRNTAERSLLSSGFFVMPRRMNSVMWIWFAMYPGKLVVVWAPTASYKIWKSNVWFRISDSFTSCISRISGDFFFHVFIIQSFGF